MDRGEAGASEEELREWLEAFYSRSLTTAAAAILASTGSLAGRGLGASCPARLPVEHGRVCPPR